MSLDTTIISESPMALYDIYVHMKHVLDQAPIHSIPAFEHYRIISPLPGYDLLDSTPGAT